MTYEYVMSKDGSYVILKIVGTINRQTAMAANLKAHAFGKSVNLNKYLMDLRASRNSETTFGNYSFAYQDMKSMPGIDRTARVALLVAPEDHSHDFIETVSRNAGLNVSLFREISAAEAYLLSET